MNENQAVEVVQEIRNAKKLNFQGRELFLNSIASKVNDFSPKTQRAEYSHKRAKYLISLYKREYQVALLRQKSVVDLLSNSQHFSLLERLKESNVFVTLCLALSEKPTAFEYLQKINAEQPASFAEEQQKNRYLIPTSISFAVRYANLEVAAKTIPVLERNIELFSATSLFRIYYQLAITFLYHEKHKEGIQWINKMLSFPIKEWGVFYWQPHLLAMIMHYERGNYDLIHAINGNLMRAAKSGQIQFPSAISKIISRLSNTPSSFKREAIFIEGVQELSSLVSQSPDEKWADESVGGTLWLKSKIQGVPMAHLLANLHNQVDNLGPLESLG